MGEFSLEELRRLRHLVGMHIVKLHDSDRGDEAPEYGDLERKLFIEIENRQNRRNEV